MGFSPRLIPVIVLLFLPRFLASQTIRTIDDHYGDSVTGVVPVYGNVWNYGPTCPGCMVQPNPELVFDRSWHDATAHPGDPEPHDVTLTFTGTAIWVFCPMPGYISEWVTTFVNISFALDGKADGTYTSPGTGPDILYNITVYSKMGLPNTQHTLVITPQYDVNPSYIAFDYAMYMYEDVETPSNTNTSISITSVGTSTAATGSASQVVTSTETTAPTSEPPTSSINSAVIQSHSSGNPTSRVDFTPTSSDESSSTTTTATSGTYYPSSTIADSGQVSAGSSTPSHGSRAHIGAIVGGVVGGFAVVVAVAVLYFCYCRRRRSQSAWANHMAKIYTAGSTASSHNQDQPPSWRQGEFTDEKSNPLLRFTPSSSRLPRMRTTAIVGTAADVDHDAQTGITEKARMQEELNRLEQEMADLLRQQASAYRDAMSMRVESSLDDAATQEAAVDGDATSKVTEDGIWENEGTSSSDECDATTSDHVNRMGPQTWFGHPSGQKPRSTGNSTAVLIASTLVPSEAGVNTHHWQHCESKAYVEAVWVCTRAWLRPEGTTSSTYVQAYKVQQFTICVDEGMGAGTVQ
ncbi:predicted protein [Postia placenta Mad-698-R]|nr:predicted protein [Postia placenta Mad-698-R]